MPDTAGGEGAGREGRRPARMAAGDDDFAGWASGEHRGEALRWGFASFAPRPLVFGPQPGGSSSVGPVPSPPPPRRGRTSSPGEVRWHRPARYPAKLHRGGCSRCLTPGGA